jgi:hypothetical protein
MDAVLLLMARPIAFVRQLLMLLAPLLLSCAAVMSVLLQLLDVDSEP